MEFVHIKCLSKRGNSTVLIQNFQIFMVLALIFTDKSTWFLFLQWIWAFRWFNSLCSVSPTGGFLVLSQKKISFVTWLKWPTKIPSPSCSTDPLFPGRLGWARRQQWGRGGGGGPLGQFQPMTLGRPFFFCSLVLLVIFVAPETFTSQVKRKDDCVVVSVAAEDTRTSWGWRHMKWQKHFLHTLKILLHSSGMHVLPPWTHSYPSRCVPTPASLCPVLTCACQRSEWNAFRTRWGTLNLTGCCCTPPPPQALPLHSLDLSVLNAVYLWSGCP